MTQDEETLFGPQPPVKRWKGLYAATPGTGPEGKQCRHCEHFMRIELSKTYYKCRKMWDYHTNGSATDIKATAPACKHFKDEVTE